MRIQFFGALKEVTGSKFIIESSSRFLVECGLYQGKREKSFIENKNIPFDVNDIEFMILSHAHIDHSGNIPNLVRSGFNKDIITTKPTVSLLKYLLPDSGHIHEKDAEYINKKRMKRNETLIEPIYTEKDAIFSLKFLKGIEYNKEFDNIRFIEAGHILGSAQILIEENGKKILFSGDLGRKELPLIRDPEIPEGIDVLIMETTYGNRIHRPYEEVYSKLKDIVLNAYENKSKIIVPSFALERAQEIIYSLNKLKKDNEIPDIPIYVDSPLAINITDVFVENKDYLDEEAKKISEDLFWFKNIHYIKDIEESKNLNFRKGPMVIIAASGMCEHGRILHHLKNNIEDENNIILIVGFQAKNTLGRKLVDGEKNVMILGKEYNVKSRIIVMNEFSAHADRNDLINYVKKTDPELIFLVHGEDEQMIPFSEYLKEIGKKFIIPEKGTIYEV
uniref:MBL fold metallo-hydrolase n=1 Tax=candidate division WOR-3 bacterium TaxID=2052148 RepID=A0A7C4UBC3_UNCW3